MRAVALAGALLGAGAVAQLAPALTAIPAVRSAVSSRLRGLGAPDRVALTFDDGPDHSTEPFLDLLADRGVTATFFLLGEHVDAHAGLVRRMQASGHEVAVHGWNHRCLALRRPGSLGEELRRTARVVEALTGERPRFYRPPYGVLTAEGLLAARSAGLEPVLWSAWGRDWSRSATPESIEATVVRGRTRGGTVLLHDSDRTSTVGSWRRTLAATSLLLRQWASEGLTVGPLRDHGLGQASGS